MAEILLIPPTDLTVIRKANGGVFPFWRMYRIIEGQEELKGHMSFQMPFWLSRFKRDEGKLGFPPAYIRILVLTHYLARLHQNPDPDPLSRVDSGGLGRRRPRRAGRRHRTAVAPAAQAARLPGNCGRGEVGFRRSGRAP
jgi:hypothetical protein